MSVVVVTSCFIHVYMCPISVIFIHVRVLFLSNLYMYVSYFCHIHTCMCHISVCCTFFGAKVMLRRAIKHLVKKHTINSDDGWLSMLPDELCLKILHYLSCRDVCTCMRVCRRLNALCNDASLWTQVEIHCRYV